MTDQPIPAAKPSGIVSSQSGASASAGRGPLSNLPVKQAPPDLQNPAQTVRVQGTVVSSNPQAQELRIATSSGQVTVQSSANLPPDTPVTLELSTQRGAEVATITVLRQQAPPQDVTNQPPAAAPPPPLQAGDTVQAILLPETTPAPPPVTLEQAAQVIQNFPLAALPELPQPYPFPPIALAQIASSPAPLVVLQNLSPDQQSQISAYLSRPDVVDMLRRVLPQDISENVFPAATPPGREDAGSRSPTPQTPMQEQLQDESLMNILTAQTGARMAQETALPAVPGSGGMLASPLALLKGLVPLLETLQPDAQAFGAFPPQMQGGGGAPLAELMPQSMYQVKMLSVVPPGASLPALIPGQLQGTVESISPSGYPVVRAGNDIFILKTTATVEPGSTVVFTARSLTADQAISTASAGRMQEWFDPLTSNSWPALQEATQVISAGAPLLASAMIDTIPAASASIAPATLFFLAAVRTGEIANWLGEPVMQALRSSGKSALADRLASDFSKIGDDTKDPLPGGWRASTVPMRNDEGIGQVQIFVRQQQDQPGQPKEEGGARPVTRFIMNLKLSRLGDMQLDGLLHQKRLELIMRSTLPLSPVMRQDLRQRFQSGLQQASMAGSITFQVKSESWVAIALPRRGTLA